MSQTKAISSLTIVPAPSSPVIDMLSPEEEKLVALIATITVELTLKQVYEESDQVLAIQQ
ncbi:MAG: hypothetical protein ABI675_19630 [Chitinophagaceae bacterium]